MIIQAPRETLLRCDAVRCGDVERLYKVTDEKALVWMDDNRWQKVGQKHYCAACCVVTEKAA